MPVRRRGRRNAARVGEVVGQDAEGSQRWELLQHAGRLHLEQALRFREVLELVEPEIVEANLLKEAPPGRRIWRPTGGPARRRGGGDPSRLVDGERHVLASDRRRRPGVHTDPHPNGAGGPERCSRIERCPSTHAHRGSGVSERDQERVPLRSQLEAVPRRRQHAAAGGAPGAVPSRRHRGSEQARRALDVREDEGDDARRQPLSVGGGQRASFRHSDPAPRSMRRERSNVRQPGRSAQPGTADARSLDGRPQLGSR